MPLQDMPDFDISPDLFIISAEKAQVETFKDQLINAIKDQAKLTTEVIETMTQNKTTIDEIITNQEKIRNNQNTSLTSLFLYVKSVQSGHFDVMESVDKVIMYINT